MTTTQLEAGRELDALVAEKVFGWVWKLDEDTYGDGRTSGKYRVICDPALWGDYPLLGLADGTEPARIDRPYKGQNPPHYSTYIAAAWEVVEKMQRRGFACDISVDCYPDGRLAGTQVSFWKASRSDREEWFAEESPLAICRAALAAVEAQP